MAPKEFQKHEQVTKSQLFEWFELPKHHTNREVKYFEWFKCQKHQKKSKDNSVASGLKLPGLPEPYICKVQGSVEAQPLQTTMTFLPFMVLWKLKPFKQLCLFDFSDALGAQAIHTTAMALSLFHVSETLVQPQWVPEQAWLQRVSET